MTTTQSTIGHYLVVLSVIASALVLALNGAISGSVALTVIALAGGVSIGSGVTLAGTATTAPPSVSPVAINSPSVTPPTSTVA